LTRGARVLSGILLSLSRLPVAAAHAEQTIVFFRHLDFQRLNGQPTTGS
jgi:hypothetical protein